MRAVIYNCLFQSIKIFIGTRRSFFTTAGSNHITTNFCQNSKQTDNPSQADTDKFLLYYSYTLIVMFTLLITNKRYEAITFGVFDFVHSKLNNMQTFMITLRQTVTGARIEIEAGYSVDI